MQCALLYFLQVLLREQPTGNDIFGFGGGLNIWVPFIERVPFLVKSWTRRGGNLKFG